MQGDQSENIRLAVRARRDAADAGRHALEALIDEIASSASRRARTSSLICSD